MGEMVQLRKEDIRMDPTADGPVAVMEIDPKAGSTKTNKSRIVPIHPHLIEQGFLAFVEQRKPGYLFVGDDRTPVKGKLPLNLRDARVNDLGQWVREIGVTAPDVQPNHGWRHTFKTIARGMLPPMAAEVRDYIQGHAPRTEGEGYGNIPLAVLKDEMGRFPRFNLDGKSQGFR